MAINEGYLLSPGLSTAVRPEKPLSRSDGSNDVLLFGITEV